MGKNPSHFGGTETGLHPVERVSWIDAIRFCNKLSEMEGLQPAYVILPEGPVGRLAAVAFSECESALVGDERVYWVGGEGYRLPTSEEWETFTRAGSTGTYCFGDDESELSEFAWYNSNSGRKTHPVAQKRPNNWGLYDVHGNVWEWCWDEY